MTPDEHDEQLDPLSPAEEEQISALLADARATEPMPADVVARLDQSLAGLTAERINVDPVPADNVIPITRTRRHRVVAVLGAAAAVAVFGLGIGTFFNQSGEGGDDSASTAADSDLADRDVAGSGAELNSDDEFQAEDPEAAPTTRDGNGVVQADRAFVVRSRHLSRDLAQIQDQVLPDPNAAVYSQFLVQAPAGFACTSAAWGRGVLVAVRYDGAPAFAAFRPPMGETQVVDVLQCGTGETLRSTTLPTAG